MGRFTANSTAPGPRGTPRSSSCGRYGTTVPVVRHRCDSGWFSLLLPCDNWDVRTGALRAVVLVGVAAAAVAGFGAAVLLKLQIADPAVQGAVVGAMAGVIGGIAGALIVAVGAWIVARMSRDEARRSALLADRKNAIVAFLRASRSADRQLIAYVGWRKDPKNRPIPHVDVTAFEPAYLAGLEVSLLAPELTPHLAAYISLLADAAQQLGAFVEGMDRWGREDGPVPDPPDLSALVAARLTVLDRLFHGAVTHLGFDDPAFTPSQYPGPSDHG